MCAARGARGGGRAARERGCALALRAHCRTRRRFVLKRASQATRMYVCTLVWECRGLRVRRPGGSDMDEHVQLAALVYI